MFVKEPIVLIKIYVFIIFTFHTNHFFFGNGTKTTISFSILIDCMQHCVSVQANNHDFSATVIITEYFRWWTCSDCE